MGHNVILNFSYGQNNKYKAVPCATVYHKSKHNFVLGYGSFHWLIDCCEHATIAPAANWSFAVVHIDTFIAAITLFKFHFSQRKQKQALRGTFLMHQKTILIPTPKFFLSFGYIVSMKNYNIAYIKHENFHALTITHAKWLVRSCIQLKNVGPHFYLLGWW